MHRNAAKYAWLEVAALVSPKNIVIRQAGPVLLDVEDLETLICALLPALMLGRVDGKFRLALEERELDSDALIDMLGGWLDTYPIVSIEEPVGEDDPAVDRAWRWSAKSGFIHTVGTDGEMERMPAHSR